MICCVCCRMWLFGYYSFFVIVVAASVVVVLVVAVVVVVSAGFALLPVCSGVVWLHAACPLLIVKRLVLAGGMDRLVAFAIARHVIVVRVVGSGKGREKGGLNKCSSASVSVRIRVLV